MLSKKSIFEKLGLSEKSEKSDKKEEQGNTSDMPDVKQNDLKDTKLDVDEAEIERKKLKDKMINIQSKDKEEKDRKLSIEKSKIEKSKKDKKEKSNNENKMDKPKIDKLKTDKQKDISTSTSRDKSEKDNKNNPKNLQPQNISADTIQKKNDNKKIVNDLFTKVDKPVDNVDNSKIDGKITEKAAGVSVEKVVDKSVNTTSNVSVKNITKEISEDSFYYIDETEDFENTALEQWASIANIIQNESKESQNDIKEDDKQKLKTASDSTDKTDETGANENEVVQRTKEAISQMREWANDDSKKVVSVKRVSQRQGEKTMLVNKTVEEKKDKVQTVQDIYVNSQMESEKIKTIFMVDEFSKTLPENLPVDVKRTAVGNIINVSGMKVENFLNDAYKRMDALNQVLENSVQKTEDIIAEKKAAIKSLEDEIAKLEQHIMDRENFQDEQTAIIEYEVQRIVGIVDFIKPQK